VEDVGYIWEDCLRRLARVVLPDDEGPERLMKMTFMIKILGVDEWVAGFR
jgi:hypothetical protein